MRKQLKKTKRSSWIDKNWRNRSMSKWRKRTHGTEKQIGKAFKSSSGGFDLGIGKRNTWRDMSWEDIHRYLAITPTEIYVRQSGLTLDLAEYNGKSYLCNSTNKYWHTPSRGNVVELRDLIGRKLKNVGSNEIRRFEWVYVSKDGQRYETSGGYMELPSSLKELVAKLRGR